MSTTVVQAKEKFLSLFDYLGRPAGPALGYAVATYASKLKEPVQLREVPQYNKPINTYRPDYLKFAFNDKNLQAVIEEDVRLYNEKQKKAKAKNNEPKQTRLPL